MCGASDKDKEFFRAFSDHAKLSVDASRKLIELFEKPGRAAGIAEDIKQLESKGDNITHETVKRLHETWITPLDRHDIHQLITKLDDVLDMVEAVAERVHLFELTESRPLAKELAEVLVKCCESIARASDYLPAVSKSAKEMLAISVEVNLLENEADGLYRKALSELFNPKIPADAAYVLDVMKWREVYDYLENATDACEDVANVIEGIVLEYA
ncbi:DUF47 family protein [soil metagenome]